MSVQDYDSPDPIAWCPGCGNFGILPAVKQALVELNIEPWQVLFVSGIGQAPKLPHYLKCNLFNGLHGRSLPLAIAAKMADSRLTVIVEGGDGDGYAEGGNHLIHALRRNVDITYLVHDNQIYGLTKGQLSPRSDAGMVTTTTPLGAFYPPINPLAIAIAMDAGMAARSFSGDQKHLVWTIKQAIQHKGFALVDILQNCATFNKVNTFGWYQKRVYNVNDVKYDAGSRLAAFAKAQEWGDRIPIGVIYRSARPPYPIPEAPLVDQPLDFKKRAKLLGEFA
jgi:2-oxoglutarate/2-oxoacid ferredoxin oxidoreductase subunit beta